VLAVDGKAREMRTDWHEHDFAEALGLLQGWVGRRVSPSIDGAGGPVGVVSVGGTLKRHAPSAVRPDEDTYEFGFEAAPGAVLSLRRDSFYGASVDGDGLVLALGNDGDVHLRVSPGTD
jgi:hypothetical protein